MILTASSFAVVAVSRPKLVIFIKPVLATMFFIFLLAFRTFVVSFAEVLLIIVMPYSYIDIVLSSVTLGMDVATASVSPLLLPSRCASIRFSALRDLLDMALPASFMGTRFVLRARTSKTSPGSVIVFAAASSLPFACASQSPLFGKAAAEIEATAAAVAAMLSVIGRPVSVMFTATVAGIILKLAVSRIVAPFVALAFAV